MKLEIGKKYLNRKGKVIKIIEADYDPYFPCIGSDNLWYAEDGYSTMKKEVHELDLISEAPITADEIKALILNRGLTITDVIDTVIELNGFIGVGLMQLGSDLNVYCRSKISAE